MDDQPTCTCIDDYIAQFPSTTAARLQELRELVRATVPDAVETISYNIPTFDLGEHHLVHFGGYAHHIGFYPVPHGAPELEADLSHYQSGKGTAKFPLDQPLPLDLIRRVVEHRVEVLTRGGR